MQKWMLQTVRVEKGDEKKGIICVASRFSSWVVVLNLPQKEHFLQFFTDLFKKPKSVKSVYIYASESSHYTFSEIYMVYRESEPPFMKSKQLKYQKMLTQQKFNRTLWPQAVLSPKQYVTA